MVRIISIANQKGGVGKTTTSHAMTARLAEKGYKTLGIDLDPQGNLSASCGAVNYNTPTVYELMKGEAEAKDVIQNINDYYVIPANIMLAGAEQELSSTGKEYRLKERLYDVVEQYDYIIIDTPPSLGILTVNAFTFCNEIIIPTTAGIFATTGIKQLSQTVENVKKYCNPNLIIKGILFTRYNPRTNISKQIKEIAEDFAECIKAPIYSTTIRNGIAIEEAQAIKEDIFTYNSKSAVAEDYRTFIDEYLKGEK